MVGGYRLKVSLNLRPGREAVAPVGVGGKRIGVQVLGHVTSHPGVIVVSPSATKFFGFFVNRQIGDAHFSQFDD